MDKEIMEQFQLLASMMEKLATKDDLQQSETRTKIFVENTVTKRIDSLFDGYKLTHEKQYELERAFARTTAELQMQIDTLQARLAKLESQSA